MTKEKEEVKVLTDEKIHMDACENPEYKKKHKEVKEKKSKK